MPNRPDDNSNSGPEQSPVEREADRVQDLHERSDAQKHHVDEAEERSSNKQQVELDARIQKTKNDTAAAGGGPDALEEGLNQDG